MFLASLTCNLSKLPTSKRVKVKRAAGRTKERGTHQAEATDSPLEKRRHQSSFIRDLASAKRQAGCKDKKIDELKEKLSSLQEQVDEERRAAKDGANVLKLECEASNERLRIANANISASLLTRVNFFLTRL